MSNQPKPGSHKYTLRLSQKAVEALAKAPKQGSDTAFLVNLVEKTLLEVPAPNPKGASTSDKVPAPKLDAFQAIKRLEEHWNEGGAFVVQQLIKAHLKEMLAWLASERLIKG